MEYTSYDTRLQKPRPHVYVMTAINNTRTFIMIIINMTKLRPCMYMKYEFIYLRFRYAVISHSLLNSATMSRPCDLAVAEHSRDTYAPRDDYATRDIHSSRDTYAPRDSSACVFSDSCQCATDGQKGPFSIYDGKIDIPVRI